MYSILIVDDEKNIREGIVRNCHWSEYKITQVYQASNGQEALQIMAEYQPEIVISDVKMPEMSGLDFLKIASEQWPDTQYVLLSGYNEFAFAQAAMKYRAQEYILKPCSMEEIHELLDKLVKNLEELQRSRRQENHLRSVEETFREQSICNHILNIQPLAQTQILDFHSFFHSDLRMLLLQLGNTEDEQLLLRLQDTVRNGLGTQHQLFTCQIVHNALLVCIEYYPYVQLLPELRYLQDFCAHQMNAALTIVVSEKTSYPLLPISYKNLLECMRVAFYRGAGIITTYDRPEQEISPDISFFNMDHLLLAIRQGDQISMLEILEQFHSHLNNISYSIPQIRAYSIEVLMSMARLSGESGYRHAFTEINRIASGKNLETIMQVLRQSAERAMDAFLKSNGRQSNLIQQVDRIILEHLANENLSLNYIAKEILYVNPAYLGKLFAAEKKKKFSVYVTEMRIEKAKKLLRSGNILIKNACLECGFGYNTQYFSRVFKNYTGYTPKEFRSRYCKYTDQRDDS